ncbi:hypothetical protein JOQ06_027326, partial [Pogonophryne albipinna]
CCSVNGHHSSIWKPLPCHFLLLVHDRRPTRSPNQALMRAARHTAQRSCMAEGLFEVVESPQPPCLPCPNMETGPIWGFLWRRVDAANSQMHMW